MEPKVEKMELVPVNLTPLQMQAIKHNLKFIATGAGVGLVVGFAAGYLVHGQSDNGDDSAETSGES